MRVLIDECVDPRVRSLLAEHEASTVHDKGWGALEDGPLLALAQNEFDVLVTIDGNLEFQQNLAKLRIGLVVVHVPKNQLTYYQAIRDELLRAIGLARPGRAVHVKAPPS
jgi:predicted nuclease of predicted toxin-antitoxin system